MVEDFLLEQFLVAFSNRDIATFSAFFAEEATMFFPPSAFGPPSGLVEGRANIAEGFRRLYERTGPPRSPGAIIEPQDLRIKEFEGAAVVTFHLGSENRRGRRTFVLRRYGTEWRIVHLHASTMEATSGR